jgi:transposase
VSCWSPPPPRCASTSKRSARPSKAASACAHDCDPTWTGWPIRPRPPNSAKLALRATAERALELERQAAQLNEQLTRLVGRAAPRTTGLLGVSTGHAGQLLVTAGQNLDRLRSEAAFAHLCAADPIPASSGKTIRHRLNPGGDRDANTALHLIAVARLRYCQRTRAYTTRRLAQGRSKREIIRCLKRYIAREVYHTLRADLAALTAT